jgi:prepilin-type N-terminal cleavage/methylation domain-containing protein
MKTKPMKKIGNRKSPTGNSPAFTLIELLVVISIIGILAAFIFPIAGSIKRTAYLNKTKAEMAQLETAIDSYKATYGFYPPSNGSGPNALVTPLYYELLGTTINSAGNYQTLDGSASISTNITTMNSALGVSGFVNCTRGSGEDATVAKSFLSSLKPQQSGTFNSAGVPVTLLAGSVGGPDQNYISPPPVSSTLNPWRYNSVSPANNPGAYDLYIQLVIKGQTNLICNWSKQVQINNTSLP